MEISENSENNLKAIVDGRQVAGTDGVRPRTEKVVEKPQGEGKAAKIGVREWHSSALSANYIDLRDIGERPVPSVPKVSPDAKRPILSVLSFFLLSKAMR